MEVGTARLDLAQASVRAVTVRRMASERLAYPYARFAL
jgi:hypothetical protein